jgi:hypothetical protein
LIIDTWEVPPGDGGAEELDVREIVLFICGWRRGMVDRPGGSTGDAGGAATSLGAIHRLNQEGHAMSLSAGHKISLISALI